MRFSSSLAVVLIAAAATPIFAQDQDPTRQQLQGFLPPLMDATIGGKKYSEWLQDLRVTDPALKESAIQAMIMYASQPQYAKIIQKEVGPSLIGILNDTFSDVSIKVNAALAVGTILLDEKDMDRGVSSLTRLLSDNESVVRLYATTALSNLGSDDRAPVQSLARKAIPSMVPMVKDKASWEIRRAAVVGLTRMAWDKTVKEGGPDARAFRALTTAVGDRCLQVRQEAAKGFLYIGPPYFDPKKGGSTKEDLLKAVEALEGLLSQHDKSTAILARVAILRIDPPRLNNPQAVDKYIQEINRWTRQQSGDIQVRIDASYALTMIWEMANGKLSANHPDPKTFTKTTGWGLVVHTAVLNLADKDKTMVQWACRVLGSMGRPAAEKAIPDLEKLKARETDKNTKEWVDWALARIHGKEAGQVGARSQ
jgi:HEAT repeat protein